jgi:hypothetical protein
MLNSDTSTLNMLSGVNPTFAVILSNSKVKLSPYRPWRLLGLREVEAPTFSDIRLTDGGKVVSPTRRPLFAPVISLVLISVRG